MEFFLCLVISLFIIFLCMYFQVSKSKLKLIQRVKLINTYTELFFCLKINYKRKEYPALFQNKEDFLYFKNAFTWLVPYIKLKKHWNSLSDWDFGMLVHHIINADNKYPNSKVAKFVEKKFLFDIMLRSVVLLFPARFNLFIHLKNNKDNKFIVDSIDFSKIKEEVLDYQSLHSLKNTSSLENKTEEICELTLLKNIINNLNLDGVVRIGNI